MKEVEAAGKILNSMLDKLGFNADLVIQQDPAIIVTVVAAVHQLHSERTSLLSDQMVGYEMAAPNQWVVNINNQQHVVSVDLTDRGYWV